MVNSWNLPVVPRQSYGWSPPGEGKGTENAGPLEHMSVMEPAVPQPPDVSSAIVKTLKESNINPESWILLTLDRGDQKTFSSPHLEKHKQEILGDQVHERFRRAHDREVSEAVTVTHPPIAFGDPHIHAADCDSSRSSTPKGRRRKVRRTKESSSPKTLQSPPAAQVQETIAKDSGKEAEEADESKSKARDGPSGYVEEMRIRVDDTEKIEDFIRGKFTEMLQMNTKTVAKAWIKEVCPAKQSKYPYNPRKPRKDGKRNHSADVKVPPWWPVQSVRFKEPDHLRMDERMELVVRLALLREYEGMPPNQPFSAARKRLCTESCVFDKPSARRAFDELLKVLERYEDYELGGIDGDTKITVRMFRRYQRASNASGKRGRQRASSTVDEESKVTEQDLEVDVEELTEPENEVEGGVNLGSFQECEPWQTTSATSSFSSQAQPQLVHIKLPPESPRQSRNLVMGRARSNYELDRSFSRQMSGYPQAGSNASHHLRRVQTARAPLVRPAPFFRQPTYQDQDTYNPQTFLSAQPLNSDQDSFCVSPANAAPTSNLSVSDPMVLAAHPGLSSQTAQITNNVGDWTPQHVKPPMAYRDFAMRGSLSGGFDFTPFESMNPQQQHTLNQAPTRGTSIASGAVPMGCQAPLQTELPDWSTQLPGDEERFLTTFRTCPENTPYDLSYDPSFYFDHWPSYYSNSHKT